MPTHQRTFTKPEEFYKSTEGDKWMIRCKPSKYITQNTALFADIIRATEGVKSILEFGVGLGNDLLALQHLIMEPIFAGIEINDMACNEVKKIFPQIKLFNGSAMEYVPEIKYDMVLSKGFLIHIVSELLPDIYEKIYQSSSNYICLVEYYNPTPLEINWRDNRGVMFKRDFCGEMMDKYRDLKLIDYGFVYHRDNNFPQDDFNWFLLKK